MRSRSGILLILAALLGVAYVTFFTDWFRSEPIRLSCRFFSGGRGNADGSQRVVFFVLPKQPISTLKVVPATEAANPKAKPLWHMVAGTKPVPVDAFDYGERIPGMKPFVSGPAPAPLVPGTEYIVLVEMGKKHGELKFTVPAN